MTGRDRSCSPDRRRRDEYDDDRRRSSRYDEDDRQYRSSRRERSRSRDRDRNGRDYGGSDRKRRYDDDSDDDRRARKKEKESKKHRETSSERRDRKAAEKSAKKAEKKRLQEEEDRRKAAELSIYSATDNPFHDVDLASKFQWAKKREKERKQGISADEASRRDAQRRAEAREELDRLNTRRAEREKEMELREAESSRMAQMAENAQMAEWIGKEDDFQLEQARKRAEIRVRENRAKPIDLLALDLKWGNPDGPQTDSNPFDDPDEEDEGAGLEVDLDEPYQIFDNLTLEETQELHEDIKMHLSLEKADRNREFWRCLNVVCEDALKTLTAARHLQTADVTKPDVHRLLDGKSYEKLIELEGSIERKLSSGEPIDPEYWEGLLGEVKVWKAKARLRTMHEVVLRNRLESLRKKQRDEAVKMQQELASALVKEAPAPAEPETIEDLAAPIEEETIEEDPEDYERDMSPPAVERIHPDDHALEVVFADDEWRKLVASRRAVLQTRFVPKPRAAQGGEDGEGQEDRDAMAERLYKQEAEKGLDEEEELFDIEAEMSRQTYNWEDKYRPRKPRYFNKVHTGYEWNKYNQVHYSSDEPPPKVVQGYKFNIFVPDLIDKSKTPTYKVVKNPDNPDLATIVFHSGPPYEDLAFHIVNKPWEHSHKRGFKSVFDRGVLQLHFNLARIHYRR